VSDPGAVDVQLVLMPYADVARPSIALGTLKACLGGTGIACSVEYANLRFAEALGWGMPDVPYLERLLGEWTFAAAAFPDAAAVPVEVALRSGWFQTSYMTPGGFEDPRFAEALDALRHFAPRFVDEVAETILARRPRVVGCSSTFEQHCASLALLRRIKALDPSVVTLMGGANCEAEMGWATLRHFPWVDVVVSGEADALFAPLCRTLLARGPDVGAAELPYGALGRAHARAGVFGRGRLPVPRAIVERVDDNPIPDYADYFAALARSSLRPRIRPGLLVETSRGCWWGEKHHCTFCGLNGGGMAYRAKSPARVLDELTTLSERYATPRFMVVDNILDMSYLRSVLPELAQQGAPYELFFETKANLRREHVALLARAGVIWVQPGIESFHDDLLRLMDKGTTAAVNVQVLKYLREAGIYATWNLLFGFPGEDDHWHAEVAAWLPLLFHLQPPKSIGHLAYDRFSPYQRAPERHGLTLTPAPSYRAVYPLPEEGLEDLAYLFVEDTEGGWRRAGPGARALARHVVVWNQLWQRPLRPVLAMTASADAIEILDTRPCAISRRFTLEGLEAEIYAACDPALDTRELRRRFRGDGGAARAAAVDAALATLMARRLLLELHGRCLALAVPGELPILPEPTQFPGGNAEALETFTPAALETFWRRAMELADLPAQAPP
jgi:magnesium-protoporphyrin IX monomethyl ester (oxidative) cyclase